MSGTLVNNVLTVDEFIDRWSGHEGGQERANYSMFLSELCDVIGVERPDPAGASHQENDYVFERVVKRTPFDGPTERGRIDLYKRGSFILEAKQSRLKGVKKEVLGQGDLFGSSTNQAPASPGAWDVMMTNARQQAQGYARKLPDDHPYPPFILTCDVGRYLEIFADFSGTGRHYNPFPDANRFQIRIEELRSQEIRQRLRRIWSDPKSLDPAMQSAKVTREIAGRLAEVSKALEDRGFDPGEVALFLMRCLFTMFVEDAALIRKGSFTETLGRCASDPKRFPPDLEHLWRNMDRGGYSPLVGEWLLRFNGKLFKNAKAFPLEPAEILMLKAAGQADWRDLEPAIFGSLFEQALDPKERKRLGAHYTPRAYVERLVNATVIEPLEEDWASARAAALRALDAGSNAAAVNEISGFLKHLSQIRVLDPACGTGNFLYVALKQMKQLEGDALNLLRDLGGDDAVRKIKDITVIPEQFLGMELNPRAVQIAELVLWIGYLQWHLKTRVGPPAEPVLGDSDHVIWKDAVLTWDDYPEKQLKRDAIGRPETSRDTDGNEIERYIFPNPRRPKWPEAEFIVGNPPFIGKGKEMREALGDDYVEALWKAHSNVNKSADFVMFWWNWAANLLIDDASKLRRFGLVTTNSISQIFNRRILIQYLSAKRPISLCMAIPDHPWTKATKDAAAVRIAMTVAEAGRKKGYLREVVSETALDTDEPVVEFRYCYDTINADFSVGIDVGSAKPLKANDGLSCNGMMLAGRGFVVSDNQAALLVEADGPKAQKVIRRFLNGGDLVGVAKRRFVIDLFGWQPEDIRSEIPQIYQHILRTVKPERDVNRRKAFRERWWAFGEPRRTFRPSLKNLGRYIGTTETSKHRIFQFIDVEIVPDHMIIAIALEDAFHLGVLSSRLHAIWALRAGGRQGVGNDPRYNKSRCFDPFPFPDATEALKDHIRALAEELDETRKQVLSEHADLTLTKLYNVLEKLRALDDGEGRDNVFLTSCEESIRDRGRVLILRELHSRIDELVFRAYNFRASLTDQEILERLVALNNERASDERRGFIRWLRPNYQIEKFGPLAHKADKVQTLSVADISKKRRFPKDHRAQSAEVVQLLRSADAPLSADQIAAEYSNRSSITEDIQEVLTALDRIGVVRSYDDGRRFVGADQ